MSETMEINGKKYIREDLIEGYQVSNMWDDIGKDIQQEMIEKWMETEEVYKERKIFSDDMGWLVRQLELQGKIKGTFKQVIDDTVAMLEEEEEKEKKRREESPGTAISIIPNDRITKLKSCLEILPTIDDQDDPDFIKVIADLVAEKEHDMKVHLEYIIVQIQVELEKIKRLVCRENPNYKAAGDLLMPVYEILFQRTLKHDILTNVEYTDDYIDKLDEFDPESESEIVDLTIDPNWRDK